MAIPATGPITAPAIQALFFPPDDEFCVTGPSVTVGSVKADDELVEDGIKVELAVDEGELAVREVWLAVDDGELVRVEGVLKMEGAWLGVEAK